MARTDTAITVEVLNTELLERIAKAYDQINDRLERIEERQSADIDYDLRVTDSLNEHLKRIKALEGQA